MLARTYDTLIDTKILAVSKGIKNDRFQPLAGHNVHEEPTKHTTDLITTTSVRIKEK